MAILVVHRRTVQAFLHVPRRFVPFFRRTNSRVIVNMRAVQASDSKKEALLKHGFPLVSLVIAGVP